jgi:tRNA-specific 2-thiouridylase
MTKEQARDIAHKNGFPNADKPSTRGICFVGKVSMKAFLKNYITFKAGEVITPRGERIGKHEGSQLYTIGERVGTSIGIHLNNSAANTKWYVAAKNTKTNTLLVAPENHPILKKRGFIINEIHLLEKPTNALKVRIRHLGPLMPCMLRKKAKKWICTLRKESEGIAEGQYAVFYNKDRVIASGEIRFR